MKKHQYLQYKNYYGSINIDTDNNLLYGKVEFIKALITYEAKDAVHLKNAFESAVDDYLAFCKTKKITPEQPFKGSLNIRIGEERHRSAWIIANHLNKSLNEYICSALDESLQSKKNISAKISKQNKTLFNDRFNNHKSS